MSDLSARLARYLERVRTLTRQRATLAALLVWVSVGLLLLALGVLYTQWSGRGDLARALWLGGMALCAWVCAEERWSAFNRKSPSKSDCAQAIARVEDPAHRTLRQDIAAAWSLQDPGELVREAGQGGHSGSLPGSPALQALYLHRVVHELENLPPHQALPGPSWRAIFLTLGAGLAGALLALFLGGTALFDLLGGQDTRPPRPAQVFWDALGVDLEFPPHTQKKNQQVAPISGQLRLPKGTKIRASVELDLSHRFSSLALVDPATGQRWAMKPNAEHPGQYSSTFELFSPMQLELVGVDKDSSQQRPKHAPAFSLIPLKDQPVTLELAPAGSIKRKDRDSSLSVAIDAQDDYGLRELSLHYQSPDNPPAKVQIALKGQPRRYKDTFVWDLSSIPVQQRSDLVYWIEARDNDPNLDPQDQLPGKITRSSRRTLILEDARSQHQSLLRQLAALRDQSVDLLAAKMRPMFGYGQSKGLTDRLEAARAVQERSTQFLTNLSRLIKLMGKDRYTARSTIRVLGEIHARSRDQHALSEPIMRFIYANRRVDKVRQSLRRDPFGQYEDPDYPAGIRLSSDRLRAALNEWTKLAPGAQAQLQDDVIRLDDLVDSELMEQLHALVASLRRAQRKLVKLLEGLDLKDKNAKARIAQLEARVKQDMERISELRALLREEVDPGFFNEDALEELAARMKHQSIKERLDNNDLAGAKESANSQLSQMDKAQQELDEQSQEPPHLSPKEKAQRFLRRELAQIKDSQKDLIEHLSEHLSEQDPKDQGNTPHSLQEDQAFAKKLRAQLEKVDDTQLNRPGRRAFQAAKDALEDLEKEATSQRFQAMEQLRHQLQKAWQGAPKKEQAKLSNLARRAQTRADKSEPKPNQEAQTQGDRQDALAKKLEQVRKDPQAQAGLDPKLQALLDQAQSSMQDSAKALDQGRPYRSRLAQDSASSEIDTALEQLSDAPPPPPPSGSESASMEAQQDRSLRQAVLDALKEDPDSLRPSTRAYYESLLDH